MKSSYKEQQQFKDNIVFVLLGIGIMSTFFVIVQSFWTGQAGMTLLISGILLLTILFALIWWLRSLRLQLSINEKRIKVQFFPFHRTPVKIKWKDVDSCAVVQSPAMAAWMGNNLSFCGESLFSLVGRNGLRIHTVKGERFFIGCSNMNDLNETLEKFKIKS